MRALVADLERNNAFRIEALRFSLHSVQTAFDRIDAVSKRIEDDTENKPSFHDVFSILTDCWSVIDSTHRAREITGHVRGLKKNSPELQVFLRNTENVETFRNIIQHIATEIPQLPENSRPTMGSYAWIHKSNPNQSVTLWLGGASQKYSVTGLVVDTREMKFANNNVFSLSDKDVRLDRVVSSCKEFEDSFDRWLASSDLLVTQEIEPSRLNFGIQMQSE